jgi:2-dehydro-3-deoxy-D-gluconate 5-dehydrogenase
MERLSIQKNMDLDGKTAIVTGGAVGIGLGIVYRLAEAGANVVIADIDGKAAEAAVESFQKKGWKVNSVRTDVSDEESVKNMISFSLKTYGSLDILVNNAGIYPTIPVMKLKPADFDRIISINLRSTFLCTQTAAGEMIKQGKGGKIINITSIDALHPSSIGLATYDASKHGMWGFTKNVALELAPFNIQVNAIAPGGIATPGTGAGKAVNPDIEAILKKFTEKIPMKHIGEPDDIGKVALFLASGLSSYMTGSQIVVDGGVLLT